MGCWNGVQPMDGSCPDFGVLPTAWLFDGQLVHDFADNPNLFPSDYRARF